MYFNCFLISVFLCLERARRGEPRGAILTQSTRATSSHRPFGCELGVFAFPNSTDPKRHPWGWLREGQVEPFPVRTSSFRHVVCFLVRCLFLQDPNSIGPLKGRPRQPRNDTISKFPVGIQSFQNLVRVVCFCSV